MPLQENAFISLGSTQELDNGVNWTTAVVSILNIDEGCRWQETLTQPLTLFPVQFDLEVNTTHVSDSLIFYRAFSVVKYLG